MLAIIRLIDGTYFSKENPEITIHPDKSIAIGQYNEHDKFLRKEEFECDFTIPTKLADDSSVILHFEHDMEKHAYVQLFKMAGITIHTMMENHPYAKPRFGLYR